MKLLRRWLSSTVGFIARLQQPRPLIWLLMVWFQRRYKLDMNEAEKPLNQYKSLVDLFTRKLKPELRPIGSSNLIHPCDSEILRYGKIENDTLIQAKGIDYNLQEFIPLPNVRDQFNFGHYITYYLCPTDYHRVHSPIKGEIKRVKHIPGDLYPVHKSMVKRQSKLYCANERVYVEIQSEWGPIGVVFVGATNVGSIRLSFEAKIRGNSSASKTDLLVYNPALSVQKGAELGSFHMGSTIVLILSSSVAREVQWGQLKRDKVKWGEAFP